MAIGMARDLTLQDLLAAIPLLAARPASQWDSRPLTGITNRSWRLTSGELDLVLRAPGPSSSRYLSRAREFHNAGVAAELGVAPPLLYADAGTGVTLQAFLADARALTPQDFAVPATAHQVGALLGKLHRSGRAFEGTMSAFPIIDFYLDLAAESRVRDPQLDALRARADPIRARLAAHAHQAVPSHIDPNPANFLLRADGALLLIDWEFSAMCEPAWDLAAVMLEAGANPAVAAALRAGYGWDPTPADASRLWLMRAALHLVAASWTAAEIAGGNPAEGLAELLGLCIARLRRMLDNPAFAGHLEQSN